jgi:hypothetical protein
VTHTNLYSTIGGSSISHEVKTVEVTLIHNWQQEVKESQLKDRPKEQQIK